MKAPGELAQLGYDTNVVVEEGDVVETGTGRRYLVVDVHRVQRRVLSEWPFRYRLTTVVMDPVDPTPDGAHVHWLIWNSR